MTLKNKGAIGSSPDDTPNEQDNSTTTVAQAFDRVFSSISPDHRYKFSVIPHGPRDIQQISDVMHRVENESTSGQGTFIDYAGKHVTLPTDWNGRVIRDVGLCNLVWEITHGRLVIDGKHNDPNQDHLWRRDIDERHGGDGPDMWHPVSSVCAEYGVSKKESSHIWDTQTKVELEKLLPQWRIVRGVKFSNRAYQRDGNGRIYCTSDPKQMSMPYEITVTREWDQALADTARSFIDELTSGKHSADNLTRLYATPVLEKYHHLGYVLRGRGGNGKSLLTDVITRSFPTLADGINAGDIAGRGGGFSQENATFKLAHLLWAIDDDAEELTSDRMGTYKKILTGGVVTGRRIGENQTDFRPQATLIIDTNNQFITGMSEALTRRFAFIRMRDKRPPQETFNRLNGFIREYGVAPFLMASCELWLKHDCEPWKDVQIGYPDDLSESEQWVVDQISSNKYAINGRNPFHQTTRETREMTKKLGLKSATRRINGAPTRVLIVADHNLFDAYTTHDSKTQDSVTAETVKQQPIPDPPTPFEDREVYEDLGNDVMELTDFQCDYVPAQQDKKAINWKKQAKDPSVDTTHIPTTASAYAVIPRDGFMVIDMDVPETGVSGWQALNSQVGAYGSDAFPRTWLVRTAHGGYHAYYKIPKNLAGKVKDSVHNNGIPVDVRADGKGYVIGAGSTLSGGLRYKLCDRPCDANKDGTKLAVPELSDAMVRWLTDNGCVQESRPQLIRDHFFRRTTGTPDMSPIPKGQRNNRLYRWGYGRLLHYPEQWREIKQDLYVRGEQSGLTVSEIDGIWRSLANNPTLAVTCNAVTRV